MLNYESILALVVIVVALFAAVTKRFLATGALVVANFLVHLISVFGRGVDIYNASGEYLGTRTVIQQELGLHGNLLASGEPIAFLQLFTSMFVHADFFHLLGNVIVLLAFALPFEERVGHRPFLGIYILSGLLAAFAQMATIWGVPTVLMGASGAVFGVIGAFAGAYPNLVLPLPLPLGFIMIFVRMRVLVAAGVWAALQVVLQFFSAYNPGSNVAYFAHLGGLVAGLLLGVTYVRAAGKRKQKPAAEAILDINKLRPFARNLSAQNALSRLSMCIDDPQLAAIWGEKFLEHATCPGSGGPIRIDGGFVVCPDGSRHDVRAHPKQRRSVRPDRFG